MSVSQSVGLSFNQSVSDLVSRLGGLKSVANEFVQQLERETEGKIWKTDEGIFNRFKLIVY